MTAGTDAAEGPQARPDTPKKSRATLASLLLAVLRSLKEPVAFGRPALHQLAVVAQQLAQLPKAAGAAASSWR